MAADFQPGYCYKFAGAMGELYEHTDPVVRDVKLDKGLMSATRIFTTEDRDRQGDIIRTDGILTPTHQANPVVLLDHGKYFPLPIGRNESPEGAYSVYLDSEAGEGRQTTYFSQRLREAEQVYWLIDEKILRGNSIGHRPLNVQPLGKPVPQGEGKPPRQPLLVNECELLEISWTALPVNAEAVRAAIDRDLICGKSMLPALRMSLEPLAQPHKVWSPGATLEVKAMADEMTQPIGTDIKPPDEVPATEEMPMQTDPASKEPHGAQVLRGAYHHMKALQAYHEFHKPMLDNVHVGKSMERLCKALDQHMAHHEGVFEEQYPALPPLAPGEAPTAPGEDDVETKSLISGSQQEQEAVVGGSPQPAADGQLPLPTDQQKAMSAVNETAGGALVPPPEMPHEKKGETPWNLPEHHAKAVQATGEFLDDMATHPNLNSTQKSACMYHGKSLKALITEANDGTMGEQPTEGAGDELDNLPPEQKSLLTETLTRLTAAVEEQAKGNRVIKRRLREAGAY